MGKRALQTIAILFVTLLLGRAKAAPLTARGDRMIADYFRNETALLSRNCLSEIKTREDWDAKKGEYRRQLEEMLGLWPMPAKTDLHPVITGKLEADDFTVERLYFQSMPHLYVTGDLYLPKNLDRPAPAILYVCGHAKVKENGVSLGNKTFYQHHGEWFARNGYVCLVIDSLELGEIEGIHHGTYNLGMWWWQSRGYTPAGVEAWNGIRALDYLCSRKEVDPNRIGMTGRSGGGAYTWYVSALDERVKVACPVAGMTDLQNYVVDGTVEGHCDCMFMDNTYRWDYPQVAALISPRPLLICNSDKDEIFPLDGVMRLHQQVRRIYALQGAQKNLGLLITEGPHQDTQDLQVPVFRWFNRFLKNDRGTIDKVATPFFKPQQLRVFDQLPTDQINTKIQDTFGPNAAPPVVPSSKEDWQRQRDHWMAELKAKTFAGWPQETTGGGFLSRPRYAGGGSGRGSGVTDEQATDPKLNEGPHPNPPPEYRERAMSELPATLNLTRTATSARNHTRATAYRFTSQHDIDLDLFVAQTDQAPPQAVRLIILGGNDWPNFVVGPGKAFAGGEDSAALEQELAKEPRTAVVWFAPRGVGPTAWGGNLAKQTHIRRRFALLGQTLDGMRVWDVRRAVQAIRSIEGLQHAPISMTAEGREAGIALYASLFESHITQLDLTGLPPSHRIAPDLFNVLQTLDTPETAAMAADRCEVRLHKSDRADWSYPVKVVHQMGWGDGRLRIEQ